MPCLVLDLTSPLPSPNLVNTHPIQELIIGLPSIAFSGTLVPPEILNLFTTETQSATMSPGTQIQIGLGTLEIITLFLDTFSLWLEQP